MLRDHFQPPLSEKRHWESFHAFWAGAIAEAMNRGLLPSDYFAEVQVHVGSRVEVDIATFETDDVAEPDEHAGGGVAMLVAPAARVWTPPKAAMELPAIYPDSLEVLIMSTEAGPTLVAAIELISPGNKDREDERRGFAAKCASMLQQGVAVVIVDIVTSRHANLHNELVRLLDVGDKFKIPEEPLYAVAYRPRRRKDADRIEVWPAPLAVGQPLPTLPLPIHRRLCVPLDLDATYHEACDKARLPQLEKRS